MPGRDLPQGGWVLPGAFVGRKYPVEVLGATAELVSRNVLSRGIDRIYGDNSSTADEGGVELRIQREDPYGVT